MICWIIMWLRNGTGNRTMPSDEALLLSRARGGDDGAFEELVRRHKDSVFNLAMRIVGNGDAAEDVLQESFIKAWQQLPRFRGEASFLTWLFRITINEARVHLRSERRRLARWEKQRDLEEAQAVSDHGAKSQEPLLALMQELPEEQRVAVSLFYVRRLSLREIAEATATRAATVKTRLARGRERLRRMAQERGLL
jgi:RNA polymerase sigma-70 factor (ECF subfamily)